MNHVILKKSREIQISKLKELRDEAEKMQEDQAQCDQVEAQLKQVRLKSYPCDGVKRSNSVLTGRGRFRANNNLRAHLNFYFQDIENTRIRIAAETRAQVEKIEKLRVQTMKITEENLNLLSDVEKIGREYETEITKYLRRLDSNQKFILLLKERVDLLKDQQFHNGDINADKKQTNTPLR